MRKGYILLELLIASSISTMILAMLYNAFSQTNIAVLNMDRMASIDVRILLLQNQMERDISGAFVPFMRKKKSASAKASADRSKDRKPSDQKGGEKTETKETKKKEQFEDVPLEKAFYSKNKGENIEVLTFVTTNPVKSFVGPKDKVKPRIARIVYKVVPDKTRSRAEARPSFLLMRQEDVSLDFAAFSKEASKKIRSYEVIKNIKKLSVEYTVGVKPFDTPSSPKASSGTQDDRGQSRSSKSTDSKKEPKIEYKTFKQWTEEEIKKTKKQKPDFCIFKVELWDNLRKTFQSFEFNTYMFHGDPKKEPFVKLRAGQGSQKGGDKK